MIRLIFLLSLVASPLQAASLTGALEQGGLVVGQVEPGAKVKLNGNPVPVSADGQFLLGFDRDARPFAKLEVQHPDGWAESQDLAIAKRDWDIQRIDGLPPRMVTPPPEVLERIAQENALIRKARDESGLSPWFETGFLMPAEGRISGIFGSQRILNGEPRNPHNGLDIAAPTGTPVVAAADGVVSLTHEDMYFSGKTVMIDHGLGLETVYIHMSKIHVEDGQQVRQGDLIGEIGSTGRSTGPHLHWGVSWYSTRLDPETILDVLPATR